MSGSGDGDAPSPRPPRWCRRRTGSAARRPTARGPGAGGRPRVVRGRATASGTASRRPERSATRSGKRLAAGEPDARVPGRCRGAPSTGSRRRRPDTARTTSSRVASRVGAPGPRRRPAKVQPARAHAGCPRPRRPIRSSGACVHRAPCGAGPRPDRAAPARAPIARLRWFAPRAASLPARVAARHGLVPCRDGRPHAGADHRAPGPRPPRSPRAGSWARPTATIVRPRSTT